MAGLTTNDVGNCCCGPCRLCFTCFDCDTGLPVSGATVAISGVGSCVTDASGTCCITVPDSGSYTVTVSGGGYKTYSNIVVASCPATIGHLITLDHGFGVFASGCNGLPLPGATITIGTATVTTGADGTARISSLDPGRYAWMASAPRMVTQSGFVDVFGTSCQTVGLFPNFLRFFSVGFSPDTNYVCIRGCAYPAKKTLVFTHTIFGTATGLYDGVSLWRGTFPNPPPGGCGCDPGDVPPDFSFDGSTLFAPLRRCEEFGNCPYHAGFPCTAFFFSDFVDDLQLVSCPPGFLMQSVPETIPDCSHFPFGSFFAPGSVLQTTVTE